MNANTITGIVRAVAPAALAYAVGRGWISQGDVGEITSAIVTLVAAGWSVLTNMENPKLSA